MCESCLAQEDAQNSAITQAELPHKTRIWFRSLALWKPAQMDTHWTMFSPLKRDSVAKTCLTLQSLKFASRVRRLAGNVCLRRAHPREETYVATTGQRTNRSTSSCRNIFWM